MYPPGFPPVGLKVGVEKLGPGLADETMSPVVQPSTLALNVFTTSALTGLAVKRTAAATKGMCLAFTNAPKVLFFMLVTPRNMDRYRRHQRNGNSRLVQPPNAVVRRPIFWTHFFEQSM